ncbi:hypothetical protein TNCV_2008781 [Trichonephila clavipes]|nr:hypothetical protein TNCV_2008781 [Trichonephila clavipes]
MCCSCCYLSHENDGSIRSRLMKIHPCKVSAAVILASAFRSPHAENADTPTSSPSSFPLDCHDHYKLLQLCELFPIVTFICQFCTSSGCIRYFAVVVTYLTESTG